MKSLELYLRKKGIPIGLFIDNAQITFAKEINDKRKISHEGVIGFFYVLGKFLKYRLATKPPLMYNHLKPDIAWIKGNKKYYLEIELSSQKEVIKKIGKYINYFNKSKNLTEKLVIFTNIEDFYSVGRTETSYAKIPNPKKELFIIHINIDPTNLMGTYYETKITKGKKFVPIKTLPFKTIKKKGWSFSKQVYSYN